MRERAGRFYVPLCPMFVRIGRSPSYAVCVSMHLLGKCSLEAAVVKGVE